MSTLRTDSIANRAGTGPVDLVKQSAAKAWANIDATTQTVRDSFGLSSMEDTATGQVTFNSTNAIMAATFAISATGSNSNTSGSARDNISNVYPLSADSWRVNTVGGDGVSRDYATVGTAINGDLA